MLKVNLNQGRYEIVQHITKSCSAFGKVRSINLFLESSPTAVVEMSTIKETEVLAMKLGGILVGNASFIGLAQRFHDVMQENAA
jgi:hypothetical protein